MRYFKSFSLTAMAIGAGLASMAAFAEADDRYRFMQQQAPAPSGFFGGLFDARPVVREIEPRPPELRPIEVREAKPVKQFPVASVLDDPTLRPGDMVVTERGIVVFKGKRGSRHDADDFSAVSYASLPKAERAFIARVDSQSRAASEGYDTGALGERSQMAKADMPVKSKARLQAKAESAQARLRKANSQKARMQARARPVPFVTPAAYAAGL